MKRARRGFAATRHAALLLATGVAVVLAGAGDARAALSPPQGKSAAAKERAAAAKEVELIEQLASRDAATRARAVHDLGRLTEPSTNALDALATAVADPEEEVRFGAIAALDHLGLPHATVRASLFAALRDRSARVRRMAAAALRRNPGAARDGMEAVAAAAREERDDGAAAALLQLLGEWRPETLATLLPFLDSERPRVRQTAAEELARFGLVAKEALMAATRHADDEVAASALWGLQRCAVEAPEVWPVLAECARSPRQRVRRVAFNVLSWLDRAAAQSMALLVEIAGDATLPLESRVGAVEAAKEFEWEGHAALPTLLRLLAEPSEPAALREAVAATLADFNDDSERVRAALLQVAQLEDELLPIRIAALRATRGHPFRGRDATEPLLRLARAKEPLLRAAAIRAIGAAEDDAEEPLSEALQKAASDRSPEVRLAALQTLREHDLAPTAALPLLAAGARDDDLAVRCAALDAMAKLDRLPADLRAPVQKALKDREARVRVAAATVLTAHPSAAEAALSTLQQMVTKEDDPNVRAEVVLALGKVGPSARGATRALELLVSDDTTSIDLATNSALALLRIHQGQSEPARARLLRELEAPDAIHREWALGQLNDRLDDALEEAERLSWLAPATRALDDVDGSVRQWACWLIERIDRSSAAALSRLTERLHDDDPEVRAAAIGAFAAIAAPEPATVVTLSEQLRDPDRRVRDEALDAVEALAAHGEPAIAAIEAMLVGEPSPALAKKARSVLAKVRGAQ